MIVISPTPYPIGFHGLGLVDDDHHDHPQQPFIVLKQATHEEWLADLPNPTEREKQDPTLKSYYFYEVSTD